MFELERKPVDEEIEEFQIVETEIDPVEVLGRIETRIAECRAALGGDNDVETFLSCIDAVGEICADVILAISDVDEDGNIIEAQD